MLVSFVRGQPLGYYASWALFSLSHHILVWLAAERACPGRGRFTRYALLGDDIVIADERVAEEYVFLLGKLGVTISLAKSLVSNNGSLEFAKRFWVEGLKKDLSPVSIRALLSVRSTLGLCQLADKYRIDNPSCSGSLERVFELAHVCYPHLLEVESGRGCGWQRLSLRGKGSYRYNGGLEEESLSIPI